MRTPTTPTYVGLCSLLIVTGCAWLSPNRGVEREGLAVGCVVDSLTGAAIEMAGVRLFQAGTQGRTDSTGYFELGGVGPQGDMLQVAIIGYGSRTVPVPAPVRGFAPVARIALGLPPYTTETTSVLPDSVAARIPAVQRHKLCAERVGAKRALTGK